MIEKIGHYSLTNPGTVYDEEALTALELAGRTAYKVDECVEKVNQHTKNLPGMVANDVQQHIDNGDFEKQIDKYAGDLSRQVADSEAQMRAELEATETSLGNRVDNLLGSVTEGSTTLDAEVIDLRLDVYGVTNPNAGAAVRKQFNSVMMGFSPASGDGYDFNTAPTNRVFYVTSSNAANAPEANEYGNTFGLLCNYQAGAHIQVFYSFHTGKVYNRYNGGGWSGWKTLDAKGSPYFTGNKSADGFDFDSVDDNAFFYVGSHNANNTPEQSATGFTFGFLIAYNAGGIIVQEYTSFDSGNAYIRYYAGGSWMPWNGNKGNKNVIVHTADGFYNQAKEMADNTHLYLAPGTYDISSFISADENGQINVGNGCIIEGMGDVKIICNRNTPSSVPSIFNFVHSDGEIKNLTLEGSNIRYLVHDDTGGVNTDAAVHKITGCSFKHTGQGWSGHEYPRSIGGGTGNNVTTIIDSCDFEDTNDVCIDYHSNFSIIHDPPSQPTHGGKIIVRNCYSDTSRVNFASITQDNGDHPVKCLVSNNAMVAEPTCEGKAFVMRAWNNVII